ncbi:NAD(P)H-dependent oxidoreductase [Micromonospora sp. WMMD712]|uniref:NADPH-dependent FMN reductase n=1 Tax=Micromonospora sp. WMMD712 TaxID=3016096 RepID=UPI00249BB5FC|nr:NAD(P)H-dependent oxidoreductase [Micromonospora sp. WMMD712]WFE55514.1 NAD(P)H-dependent oxidoreductase [Micromonospora sp. WMMD712]
MSESPYQLAVIVGSVRDGRFGPVVANWFCRQARQRGDLVVDLIDLAHVPAALAGAPGAVAPDEASFAERIAAADAVVVVTPEYNHSYPGPLKAAIDSVGVPWHAKPVGFVSYGGISGGLRAVEALRVVFAELHAVTIRETVSFAGAHACFDAAGEPVDAGQVDRAASAMLDQLGWWAEALRTARAARPYGS